MPETMEETTSGTTSILSRLRKALPRKPPKLTRGRPTSLPSAPTMSPSTTPRAMAARIHPSLIGLPSAALMGCPRLLLEGLGVLADLGRRDDVPDVGIEV